MISWKDYFESREAEVVNDEKPIKQKNNLKELDDEDEDVEEMEEKLHKDLDGDDEEGESEEHKKKVLGKKK